MYFLIGFVTSFGWWSAGKIQKTIDNTAVVVSVDVKKQTDESTK